MSVKRGIKARARALIASELFKNDVVLVVVRPDAELAEELIGLCVKRDAAERVALIQDPKVIRQLEEVKSHGSSTP